MEGRTPTALGAIPLGAMVDSTPASPDVRRDREESGLVGSPQSDRNISINT